MAEFKLGRIRFVWKGNWITGTQYYKDDIVAYGGKTFLCVVGHTANADFYSDLDNLPTRWNQFSDGQDWKGNWAGTTLYKVNDIVKYGGYLYICNDGHTSQSTLELDQSKWDLFAEGVDWKGSWATTTTYKVNDLVKYGGYVYICNTAHSSAATSTLGLEADQSKWDIFSKGVDWKGVWSTSTRYKVGDLVKYGGTTYVCSTAHTSAATAASGLEVDQASWDYFNQGIDYKGTWASTTRYKVNDVVKNGGGSYICVNSHTSTSNFATDYSYWSQFVEGVEFEGEWASSTVYQPGDIVRYGGNSYIAKTAHTSGSGSPPSTNTTDYDLFSTGFRLQGDWSAVTAYRIGEIVRNGGYTYAATADNTNQQPPNASYWSKLNEGIDWKGNWATATNYILGDSVKYGAFSYICVQAHLSSSGADRPDNDGVGAFWNLLTAGNEESALTTTGDLVYYSGAGPARLPIGEEGQVLTVSNGLPSWDYFGRVAKVFYVAPHGVNQPAPIYGITLDQPWASIRYACEQIENGHQNQDAAYLLKQNRSFIQKEIVEWVDYQIANTGGIWSAFTYNKAKCQRDMGLLIDAIVHDMTHTGNVKIREVAQSYFTPLGVSYITGQTTQTVQAINYGVTLIGNVLANTAPAANYQTLNGIGAGSRIKQIIDSTYSAESGTSTLASSLASVVTDAITAGTISGLPTADTPQYSIFVKTGQFYEVLPIIVPANTAIIGDELRSTRISPQVKVTATSDKAKTVATLQRLQSITDEIVTNTAVTPTSGNTATQYTSLQLAGSVGSSTAVSSISANVTEIKDILTNGTGAANAFVTPDPTGYNVSYLVGYGDARAQLEANRTFLKDEVTAYINSTYTGTVTASSSVDNSFTIGSTSWMTAGQPIRFTGTVFGGVSLSTTYYVKSVISLTKFSISATSGGDTFALSTASGSAGVSFYYNQVTCQRDVGYVIDAIKYDLTYDGNYQTRVAADSYFTYGVGTYGSGERTATLGAYARLKIVIGQVILETAVTPSTGNTTPQDTSGTAGSAGSATFAETRVQDIVDTITNNGTLPTLIEPGTSWVATALTTARTALVNAKSSIQSDAVQYIVKTYPALEFNTSTCSRDVGYIVDALGYDLMFGANFASIKAGLAYRRGTASAQLVVANQLAATNSILDFINKKCQYVASTGASVLADLIWTDLISYINTGTSAITVGTNSPSEDLNIINGARILELNKSFMVAEATAYIANTFTTTVTASTGSTNDTFTCGDTSWMVAGDPIRFSASNGGVTAGVTYYVHTVVNSTTFKVTTTLGGSVLDLTTAGPFSMTVSYYYSVSTCERDVGLFVDGIVKDLIYTGNYYSTLTGRYYRSALTGSKLEDMFYVRNGCGLRNCTLLGLDGTSDGNTTGVQSALSVANGYGTQRPNAGAYVSLDPGWGPNDSRAWVTNKSTYVQNVTTFGTGCTGQKIDGTLHNGGVDSIVSNDFTQVLSDGIGAWVLNLGRAELVSVFTYYCHIGYLAENGGKIRATNGNNSYGDFGSVSEGIDVTETKITGQINNRASEANVANVIVSGTEILAFEYANCGSEYTSATYTISGSGSSAAATGNETRDGAVFNIRMTDPGDSSGTGGTGYISASNQAQTGNTTAITLAAADTAGSSVYTGMAIFLTAGAGAGQYGYINSYNAGSKVAQIYKYSTGTAGWDHVVPGRTIAASLDVTTTYEITPRIELTAPPYTVTTTSMSAARSWTDLVYGNGYAVYTGLTATGSVSGSLATFNVTRVNGTYTVTVNVPGNLYAAGETLTILGTSLGGTTPAHDLTITVTSVNSPSGSIARITSAGNAVPPKYVALASGTTSGAYSLDGITWVDITLPTASAPTGATSNQWRAIAYGVVSNVSYYVAVARETSVAAYSTDGINWTAANLGDVADWTDIAYGNGTFVAIAESTSGSALRSVSTNGGATWSLGTLAGAGARCIAYGGTRFVAVEGSFSNQVSYSTNGVTWTNTTMPANDDSTNSNWVDIAYGNGRFVAIAENSAMAAYSFDGATWVKSNLPAIAEWTSVSYGQGLFYATSLGDVAASSEDGVNWTVRSSAYASLTVTATAKDTDAGYIARTLPSTGYWTDVLWDGTQFIAVGHDNGVTPAAYGARSTDGETWVSVTFPLVSSQYEYTAIAYNGTNQYIAIINNTRHIASSSNGTTWTGTVNAIPTSGQWADMVYGNGRYIAVSSAQNRTAYSTDGTTWANGSISALSNEYTGIAVGTIGSTTYFVVTTGLTGTSQVSAYSTDGLTWTANATGYPSAQYWSSVAFGGGRFVAVSGNAAITSTAAAYSTNGTTWTAATMPGAAAKWNKVVYGGGAFTAFAYGSNRTAYSTDGTTWVEGPAMSSSANWNTAAYGNERNVVLATTGTTAATSNNWALDTNLLTTSSTTALEVGDRIRFTSGLIGGLRSDTNGYYFVKTVKNSTQFTVSTTATGSNVVLSTGSGSMAATSSKGYVESALGNPGGTPRWVVVGTGAQGALNIRQGARTRAKAVVADNKITGIRLLEPGSGYVTAPTLTITDPNNTGADASTGVRIGNGALAQPTFTNRGSNYTAAAVEITGDGYADNYQVTAFVAFKGLTGVPKQGSNVQIAGIDDVWYRLVNVTNLLTASDGTYTATLQVSPAIGAAEAPDHDTATTIRRRYSQVRLTGHDFLDIGTGNFTESNYPGLPLNDPIPAQETQGGGGGRVFWTATDQDGNFRVGGLFNVEQSTGVATLNADAFNIAGLNELSLGSVALGGSGATITEFSTDPFFTQDSDTVIPTQRAIKAYINSQIGGGGSTLNVNTLTAGVIYIAGQTITTTTSQQININTKVNFKGGIVGDALVLNYFLLNS